MKKILLLTLALALTPGCKTQKKRLAQQNNSMVSIHRTVHQARFATETHKKDKAKYEESVQALMVVLKKQTKALEQMSVDAKMQPLKELLQRTLEEMTKGYRSVLAYLEKSKNLEAQTQIATVEKQFADRTLELRNLSRKIAKENNIKIKDSEPAPKAPLPAAMSAGTTPPAPMKPLADPVAPAAAMAPTSAMEPAMVTPPAAMDAKPAPAMPAVMK